MNSNLLMGIILAVISGLFLVMAVVWMIYNYIYWRTPDYMRKLPEASYTGEERELLRSCYNVAGSIEGMLSICISKCKDKKLKKRLRAADSYLKESRYKDYETALFFYASDGSKETEALFRDMIENELRKRRGLPMKTGGRKDEKKE